MTELVRPLSWPWACLKEGTVTCQLAPSESPSRGTELLSRALSVTSD